MSEELSSEVRKRLRDEEERTTTCADNGITWLHLFGLWRLGHLLSFSSRFSGPDLRRSTKARIFEFLRVIQDRFRAELCYLSACGGVTVLGDQLSDRTSWFP